MPDVVILTARYGHGHLSAAENIRIALDELRPDLSCEVVDPFAETNPRIYKHLQDLYRFVSTRIPFLWYWFYLLMDRTRLGEFGLLHNRDMARFFRSFAERYQPRLVITTYPVYAAALGHFCGTRPERPFPILTVITDSVSINRAWLRGASDYYLVAEKLSALSLQKKGVPAARILVTGFPTPPAFARLVAEATAARATAPPDRPLTILYLPNQATRNLFQILDILGSSARTKVILALGRREKLIRRVKSYSQGLGCDVEVLGWVPGICRRMPECDLVITKAGGATVHEALAAGCPVIISQVTPGQEEGNARLIESLGMGFVVRKSADLKRLMRFCHEVNYDVLENMRRNVDRIRRPDASFRIARLAARLATTGDADDELADLLAEAAPDSRPTPTLSR